MNRKQKNQKNMPKKACTTSIYRIPACPAPRSQQQQNHQTNKCKDIIKKQQIKEELMERVGLLEETVSAMEGELAVVQRSSMIVTGLQKPKNDEKNKEDRLNIILTVMKEARIDKNDFWKHVDKIHLIGCWTKWKPSENYKILLIATRR